jgi:hypothetical protein
MKTTMIVPEDLWAQAKIQAVRERRDLKDVVADALRLYLKTAKK